MLAQCRGASTPGFECQNPADRTLTAAPLMHQMRCYVYMQEEELEKKKALATPGYAELTAMVRNKTIGNSAGGSGSQRQATVDAAERAVT